MFTSFWSHRTAPKPGANRVLAERQTHLRLETLEGRDCASAGYLLVSSQDNADVLRYDERTGAFVDTFVPKGSGGLTAPGGLLLGPADHNLYVSSGVFPSNQPNHNVLSYDGGTGSFRGVFADGGQTTAPRGLLFGPDGNLYVADGTGMGKVLRYNGNTGEFIDNFVPANSGGLVNPFGMVFGPDSNNDGKLDLYVASIALDSILCYDGTNGAFIGDFIPGGTGGLKGPLGLTFGPDGNLYVASSQLFDFTQNRALPGSVLCFEGPSGQNPGAFLGTFVPAGSGGLNTPISLLFGPDANGDGVEDLYVSSSVVRANFTAQPGTSEILRFDGATGAFIDTFVTPDSGGLRNPVFMTFTETDPTTLNYNVGENLMAAASINKPTNQTLRQTQVAPLLGNAIHRWQAAGVDTSGLGNIQIQVTNLGGLTLGMASSHTITLDDNAAGWGWFVDKTPSNDSEFLTPGNQGEKNRMDLLTVLEHEIGHLLGHEHETTGVMIDTLPAGTRRAPGTRIDASLRPDGRDLFISFLDADQELPGIASSAFTWWRHKK